MAGEFQFKVKRTVTGFGMTNGNTEQTVMCDGGTPLKKTIPANTANAHFVCPIDIATTKVISFETNKDCHIYCNAASGDTPDQDLTMLAGVAKSWVDGDDEAIFLNQTLTDIYVTTGSDAVNLSIIEGHDATPALGE